MFRKIILLAILSLFVLPYAHADEISKRAKIEEMFIVLKMDSMMQQMMTQGIVQGKETVRQMMGGNPLTSTDQKIVDDSIAKMIAVVSGALSWEKLKPTYVDLYASAYTEDEVDGILAFYRSPVGQTLLAKTPELITKAGVIISARTQSLAPQMQEIMVDLQKQFQAAHSEKAPAK